MQIPPSDMQHSPVTWAARPLFSVPTQSTCASLFHARQCDEMLGVGRGQTRPPYLTQPYMPGHSLDGSLPVNRRHSHGFLSFLLCVLHAKQ